jgi:hypothetical protein
MKRLALFLAVTVVIFASACRGESTDAQTGTQRVPSHIPTWAYDERFYQGESTSAADVQRLLTYAEGGLNNDKAVTDCKGSGRCSSVFYFNPHLVYDKPPQCPASADRQFFAAAQENWFVHQAGYSDQAHRVQGTYTFTCKGQRISIPVYAVNNDNPAVQRFFSNYLQQNANSFDYFLNDDTKTTITEQLYGPGGGMCKGGVNLNGYCTTSTEFADNRALEQTHKDFVDGLRYRDGRPMRFVYNSMAFGPQGARLSLLNATPAFVGAVCENCIISAGTFRPNMYAKVLDAMAAVNQIKGKLFVELNTGNSPTGSDEQIAQRLTTTAVAWLGFADGQTVVWPNLEFSSRSLAVWPEDQIYPTGPVQTMRSSNSEIAVTPNVWRREFRACYMNGAPIGPCAAVLNGTASPVTPSASWFRSSFGHSVALRGGDAVSGGSVDFKSAPVGAIAPGQAALLVR